MSMTNFVSTVQFVANMIEPPADKARRRELADVWLTPATVADFSESDFRSPPPEQRGRLRDAVARFRAIAGNTTPNSPDYSQQMAEARAAFETIREILKPYMELDSEKAHQAIWKALKDDSWWVTFDYKVGKDSAGDPAVWVWLIVKDDIEIEAPETRAWLRPIPMMIRKEFHEAGIERWPYVSVRTRSEVKNLMAREAA